MIPLAAGSTHACAFTILPMGEVDARFVAKDCRKLVKLVALPVPPKSETRESKLVCRELSVVVVELVEAPVNDALRLCTSAAKPVPALDPDPDTPLQLESELALALVLVLSVLSVPSVFDSAWSAAMRLCMKVWKAVAMSVDEEALEVDPVVPVVLVEAVLVAADVVAAAELAVVDEVAPMEANALNTADTRPPPGGGGGRALPEVVVEVPELVVWFCWDSMLDKADSGMDSPLLLTELMVIWISCTEWINKCPLGNAFTPSKFSAVLA
jgi:hypothetical protein